MTASSTRRSRSVSSSGMAINLAGAVHCPTLQARDQGVQSEPALHGQAHSAAFLDRPTRFNPELPLVRGHELSLNTRVRAQPEVSPLHQHLTSVQRLASFEWVARCSQRFTPGDVLPKVPSPLIPRSAVRAGTETKERNPPPVTGVVRRAKPG